ncbi:hypothetical protein K1719_003218 [Acacia pycnantha]|nr:hypothetical protein K1719_003218 [Acacia pycnantha]
MDHHIVAASFHLVSIDEKLKSMGKLLQNWLIGLPLSGPIPRSLKVAGRFDKKGRLFGMGVSTNRVKPMKHSSSGSVGGVSVDELKRMKALVQEQAAKLNMQGEKLNQAEQQMSQQAHELHQTQEMMKQMQLVLQFLMKEKGMRSAPGDDNQTGDDEDDDPTAAV